MVCLRAFRNLSSIPDIVVPISLAKPVITPTHHQIWQVWNDKDYLNVSCFSEFL